MRAAGLIGVVCALGAVYFVYSARTASPDLAASPVEQVDIVSIRAALLEIGQAERRHLVEHGSYATLEQLQAAGPRALGAGRRGYVFEVEPRGSQGFIATATPVDPDKPGWPILSIDETMQIATR